MDLASSYSAVASEYADKIFDELKGKPKDRELLDQFAAMVGQGARVCDVGCGPGQIAKYLAGKGLDPIGIDISPGMIDRARKLNPNLEFQVCDLLKLPLPDSSLSGVAAFYSLIHIHPSRLSLAFDEIFRVLRPGGIFLFAFHVGKEAVHLDEWWNHPVNLDFYYFEVEPIKKIVLASQFEIITILERPPYDEQVEHQSDRAYFLVRKPAE